MDSLVANPDISLLQAIAFCFEKQEIFDGWAQRLCPFPTEQDASVTFTVWIEELTRWKGPPLSDAMHTSRRAAWPDLRIKLAGRGIGVWIKVGSVHRWWSAPATWEGDPCAEVYDWEDNVSNGAPHAP